MAGLLDCLLSSCKVMDQPDLRGRTALMWASASGACGMIKAMCRHGAVLGHQVSAGMMWISRMTERSSVFGYCGEGITLGTLRVKHGVTCLFCRFRLDMDII